MVEEDAEERQARMNRQMEVNGIDCCPFHITILIEIVLVDI